MSDIELPRRDCQQNTPSNDIEQQPDNIDFMAHDPSGQSEPSVEDRADSNRRVRRVLWGKHIFMITISAVLNVGFYVRIGTILRLAGPLALFLSFALLTFLAWGVMQCITEMVSIWPVPGALVEFIRCFVDEDLALTVGVTYWFTYSITTAAIITAIAADVAIWPVKKGIDGAILFFLIPVVLIAINSLGVGLYGFIELVAGSTKLVLAAGVLLICMPLINNNKSMDPQSTGDLHDQFWNSTYITFFDSGAANSWSVAFFISLSFAAFAFLGVEIPAATALEARISARPAGKGGPVDRSVKFSAIWVPIIAGIIYVLGALLISFDLDPNDSSLPRASWLGSSNTFNSTEYNSTEYNSTEYSAFVISAKRSAISGHQGLADFINVCLLFTQLTAANTTLYVASRTLFSLTKDIHAHEGSPQITKILAFFGKTNRRKVPMRALGASCVFCWVPFLYLKDGTTIGALLDVLANMGSVSCIMVWVAECIAFIRFYRCLWRHRRIFEQRRLPYLCRFDPQGGDDYPYRSHGQPFTAFASLAGCIFILVVADGAALWKEFQVQPFLSAYLSPIFFFLLFVAIKLYYKNSWSLVDLSEADTVIYRMKELDKLRWRNTADDERLKPYYNCWGLFDC